MTSFQSAKPEGGHHAILAKPVPCEMVQAIVEYIRNQEAEASEPLLDRSRLVSTGTPPKRSSCMTPELAAGLDVQ
jgi:hypothetical protein